VADLAAELARLLRPALHVALQRIGGDGAHRSRATKHSSQMLDVDVLGVSRARLFGADRMLLQVSCERESSWGSRIRT
jgi:hypothetical protein